MHTFILVYSFISFPSGAMVVQKMPVAECTQSVANVQGMFKKLGNKAQLVSVTCSQS